MGNYDAARPRQTGQLTHQTTTQVTLTRGSSGTGQPADLAPQTPVTGDVNAASHKAQALPAANQVAFGSEAGITDMQALGLDPGALGSLARELLADPQQLSRSMQELGKVLQMAREQGYALEPSALTPDQLQVVSELLQKSGCTELAAQLRAGSGPLPYDVLAGIHAQLGPAHSLVASSSKMERNSALAKLRLAEDPLGILPQLEDQRKLSGGEVQTLNLYKQIEDLAFSSDTRLLGLTREAMSAGVTGHLTTHSTRDLSLTPMDLVLGNLMLPSTRPEDAMRLDQLLQRVEQNQLTPAEASELLRAGLHFEGGKLYAVDPDNPAQKQALNAGQIANLKAVSSALGVPPGQRSQEMNSFLGAMRGALEANHLVETLTHKRQKLQEKADRLDREIAAQEQQLNEIQTNLSGLDSLLQRFDMDNLSRADIALLNRLGIDIGKGTLVKNKFYDSEGNLIRRGDIEARLRSEKARLEAELAAKRKERESTRSEIDQTDGQLRDAIGTSVQKQNELTQAWTSLSPAEQQAMGPAMLSLRQRFSKSLLNGLRALNMPLSPEQLEKLIRNLNPAFKPQIETSDAENSREPVIEPGPVQTAAASDQPVADDSPWEPVSPLVLSNTPAQMQHRLDNASLEHQQLDRQWTDQRENLRQNEKRAALDSELARAQVEHMRGEG